MQMRFVILSLLNEYDDDDDDDVTLWTFSHMTELTQWDHPEMAEVLHCLCTFEMLCLNTLTTLPCLCSQ